MYPRISDLINDLLGTNIALPIQTYGFFVALAFVVAGFVVYHELKRKGKNGQIPTHKKPIVKGLPTKPSEYFFTTILYFVIGFKIVAILLDYDQFVNNPQSFLLSTTGSFLGGLVVSLIAILLVFLNSRKKTLDQPVTEIVNIEPQQITPAIILIAAVTGIFGAKIFDLVEHLDDFFRDPIATLFSFSGLTFYGGLIVATLAVSIYGERHKIKWAHLADAVAPALMIAYAVGRIGCQLSGDGCWGIPNLEPKPEWLQFLPDWMWSFTFPHNVIKEGIPMVNCHGDHCFELPQGVFPTSFYETTIATIFFIFLWSIRKRISIPGALFSIYLMLNGIERFTIEFIRVNIDYTVLGLHVTQAQMIALGLFLSGLFGLIYFSKIRKHSSTS